MNWKKLFKAEKIHLKNQRQICRCLWFSILKMNIIEFIDMNLAVEISTVQELTEKTEDDMAKVRNLGKKSFDEVVNKLHSLGLDFKSDDD